VRLFRRQTRLLRAPTAVVSRRIKTLLSRVGLDRSDTLVDGHAFDENDHYHHDDHCCDFLLGYTNVTFLRQKVRRESKCEG
jgi:hypothetical protein